MGPDSSERQFLPSLYVLSEAELGLRGLIWCHFRTSLLHFAVELWGFS